MALIFADSFEHYGVAANSSQWGPVRANMLAGAYAVVLSDFNRMLIRDTQARTGSRSLYIESYNAGAKWRVVFPAKSIVGCAFGLFFDTLPSNINDFLFTFYNSETAIVTVQVSPAGALQVRRGNHNGSILGSSDAGEITASAFNHIEAKVVRDNVVGEIEIRVNGVTALKLTDLDLGTIDIDGVGQAGTATLSGTAMYLDDLIIWNGDGDVNNDFFGPARVLTVFADGEGTHNDWNAVGAATPHEAIDETTPDGDATYIAASTVGDKQSLTIPELPPEVATVAGVFILPMTKLGSAGTGNMKVSIESDGAIAEGTDTPLTTAYTYWPVAFEKDPATGAQFDKAALEAAEIIIEKTA